MRAPESMNAPVVAATKYGNDWRKRCIRSYGEPRACDQTKNNQTPQGSNNFDANPYYSSFVKGYKKKFCTDC